MHQGSGSARSRQPLSPSPPGTAPRTITRIICANTPEGTAATTCALREPGTQTMDQTKYDRRRFLGSAAMSIAAAKFVATNSAHVESGRTKASSASAIKPPANPLFGSLKQIDAG